MDDKTYTSDISFLDFIEKNYYVEKEKLKNICGKFNSLLFDEDVFHDTIIKVNETISNKRYSPEVYDKYMKVSFRTNLIREKLYHRNSMTEHTFNFEGCEPYTYSYVESTIDFNMVIDLLKRKFGEKITLFYIDWLSGYDINTSMKKNHINSGYYYVKKITNFIRGYHKNGKIIY